MSAETHGVTTFGSDLQRGKAGEEVLDEFFRTWYTIEPVPLELEKVADIDRLWTDALGRRWTIEIKTDDRAADTGRFFIETGGTTNPWAKTSLAQLLIFYVPGWEMAWIIPMTTIRRMLPEWIERGEMETTMTTDVGAPYRARGCTIPIGEVEALGAKRIDLTTRDPHRQTDHQSSSQLAIV
jgi:hypothetical protein